MIKTIISVFVALAVSHAAASDEINYYDARVVAVDTITQKSHRMIPRQSCETVDEILPRKNQHLSPGAIIGTENLPSTRPMQRCITYSDREFYERVVGYNVTFEFNGRLRTTRMNRDPGNYIQVKVVTKVYAMD